MICATVKINTMNCFCHCHEWYQGSILFLLYSVSKILGRAEEYLVSVTYHLSFYLGHKKCALTLRNQKAVMDTFFGTKSVSFGGYSLGFWVGNCFRNLGKSLHSGRRPTVFHPWPRWWWKDGLSTSRSVMRSTTDINTRNFNPTQINSAYGFLKSYSLTPKLVLGQIFVIVLENYWTDLSKVLNTTGNCRCYYLYRDYLSLSKRCSWETCLKTPLGIS